ncbi:diguanylate cyclase [Sphingomonas sp. PB2P12]|uniref:diguanylate cyclase n=1 Tax=Sphingomonas sandaracina TaxID=3096157 RepID=UPI002FCC7B45
MLSSLSSRIVVLGVMVVIALTALAALLIHASLDTRDSFARVTHSTEVIETMSDALDELRDAESGQRGFIITHNPVFAQSFEDRIAGALSEMAQVVSLTVDNPVQNSRAAELHRLVRARIAVLRGPLDLGKMGAFDKAAAIVASGHGRDLMATITIRARTFLDEERNLQTQRTAAAGQRLKGVRLLAIAGVALIALIVILVSGLVIHGIKRPAILIREAMADLGKGDRSARITSAMGSREFDDLASGYNAMANLLEAAVAEQVQSEHQLQHANVALVRNADSMRERGEAIELLGGMAHRMQAARTDVELAEIVQLFVPRVLPDLPGALFVHNNSRNLLTPMAAWGGVAIESEGFAPDHCWALRRGQSHFAAVPGGDIVCAHVGNSETIYHCEPLLASGEVIGVLYLEGMIAGDARFQLTVLAENIASALVNHRLQRDLREQTIRDPLTGLFNRRYMEETLAIEIARAARGGPPLSLVMCDVDHFKRFNDEFGHDAGDFVLHAVASEMRARFRDGDVVCRFGGEEFTIIAPGTTAETLLKRVEIVRQTIADLTLVQHGKRLGSTSMSFGLATWNPDMSRDGSTLIQTADAALYQAKREGRNRAIVSPARMLESSACR